VVDFNSVDFSKITWTNYAQAFNFAKAINSGVITTGSCSSSSQASVADHASTGVGGAAAATGTRYTCVKFDTSTQTERTRWITASESACQSTYISTEDQFTRCLKFGAHMPGSFYILGGSAVYELQLGCRYTTLNMKSWDTPEVTYAGVGMPQMNTHHIICDDEESGLKLQHGFLQTEQRIIDQTWPGEAALPQRVQCHNASGTGNILKNWQGDIQLGLYELVSWCRDKKYSATECFSKVVELVDPTDLAMTGGVNCNMGGTATSANNSYTTLENILVGAYDDMYDEAEYAAQFLSWSRYAAANTACSWDAFRRLYGWGWAIEQDVIGYDRWKIVNDALYQAELLPIGTAHNDIYQCTKNGQVLFETPEPMNVRSATLNQRTPWENKMPNILGGLFVLALPFSPVFIPKDKDQQPYYFWLGIGMTIFLAGVWPFDVAVSSMYLEFCQLRLLGLFDDAGAAFFGQLIDRVAAGANAAILAQGLLWASTYFFYNTGEMPRQFDSAGLFLGLCYACTIGIMGLTSSSSCVSVADLYSWDVAFPAASGICIFLFLIAYRTIHSDNSYCVQYLRQEISHPRFLWSAFPKQHLETTGFNVLWNNIMPGNEIVDVHLDSITLRHQYEKGENKLNEYVPVPLAERPWPIRFLASMLLKAGCE